MSFPNATTTTGNLAESDDLRKLLFECPRGDYKWRIVDCMVRRKIKHALWTSGGATLERMAGVTWGNKEYYLLDPDGLLQDSHKGREKGYQIGDIELETSLGIAAFCGDMWNGGHIILPVADIRNTFALLIERNAKMGAL